MPTLPKEEDLTVKNDPEGDDIAEMIDKPCKKGEDEAPEPDFEDADLDEPDEDDLDIKSDEEDDFEEADPVEDGLDEEPDGLPEDSDEEATVENQEENR